MRHLNPFCTRHKAPDESGFTLLELMIALVVFSIGMLGLSGLFTLQITTNADALRRNIANNVALSAMEELKEAPYYTVRAWDPKAPAAERPTGIPCLGPSNIGNANPGKANEVDCLNNTQFPSDADFVSMTALAADGQAAAGRDYTSAMEVKRTYSFVTDSPVANMKTITVQVEWRVAGSTDVRSISYTTVRDMDAR